jgi:hypothetical protein
MMDPRIRNRQVVIDKASRQKKNGAAEDAVTIDIWLQSVTVFGRR